MAKHRRAYEAVCGAIPKGYHVHHIDWDSNNNAPDNLIALPEHIHVAIHRCEQSSINTRAQVEQLIRMFDELEVIKSKGLTREQKLLWIKHNMQIAKALGIKKPKKHKQMDFSWLPYMKQFKK